MKGSVCVCTSSSSTAPFRLLAGEQIVGARERYQARAEALSEVGHVLAVARGLVRNCLDHRNEVLGAVRELAHQEGYVLLLLAALGHIERHAQHGEGPAILRADYLRAAQHPANFPVGPDNAELLAEPDGFSVHRLLECLPERSPVVRVHEAQHFVGACRETRRGGGQIFDTYPPTTRPCW